jgi:acetyl-CoA acetyltransferase
MAYNAANKVAIIGMGRSKITRKGDRAIGALAVEASLKAIADAGLTVRDIDGLSTYPESSGPGVGPEPGPSAAPLRWMVDGLGIEQINWWSNGGGNISTAIGTAAMAIASGMCNYILVWRAMYQPRSGAFGSGTRNAPRDAPREAPRAPGLAAYGAPYGAGDAPTGFAPAYMRYMKMYGARKEHMAAYALSCRANANKNPMSVFYDQPMTFEDYMNCRMIADPLCLFDCDMPVDGAAAIVLAAADRAKDAPETPAYITALGSGGFNWKNRPPEEWQNDTARNISRTLWASTYMTPKDMDGCEFYDGFSPDIYWWLEEMNFCGRGEAYEYIQNGRIRIGGELPINTFGGQVSEGRLHGIGHWCEGVLQIRRKADDKPGDGARNIVHNGRGVENLLVCTGMLGHGVGVILAPEPR